MTDGDWFEQRKKDGEFKSVAYIETIEVPIVENADKNYPPFRTKIPLCREIQEKMKIPAYIVWHNSDCTEFLVLRFGETTPIRMNADEYKKFIENL
jgi:hypothetical protein